MQIRKMKFARCLFSPESPQSSLPGFSEASPVPCPHPASPVATSHRKWGLRPAVQSAPLSWNACSHVQVFFKGPKDLNAPLLLKSLAVVEVIMGVFQLYEGDSEGSPRRVPICVSNAGQLLLAVCIVSQDGGGWWWCVCVGKNRLRWLWEVGRERVVGWACQPACILFRTW